MKQRSHHCSWDGGLPTPSYILAIKTLSSSSVTCETSPSHALEPHSLLEAHITAWDMLPVCAGCRDLGQSSPMQQNKPLHHTSYNRGSLGREAAQLPGTGPFPVLFHLLPLQHPQPHIHSHPLPKAPLQRVPVTHSHVPTLPSKPAPVLLSRRTRTPLQDTSSLQTQSRTPGTRSPARSIPRD